MVNRNYRLLGIMWEENRRLHTETVEYRSLSGYLDNNKRLDYSDPARQQLVSLFIFIICQSAEWFAQLLNQFETSTFNHYRITMKTTGKVFLSFYLLLLAET